MRTANAALTGGSVLAALLLAVGLSTSTTNPCLAQAGTQGQWRTLTNQLPINPVHVALLRNGQVLIVAGSGNVAAETNFQAAVWDPASETFLTQALGWDMFCNGMVTLHDGRVLINGGNLQYDPFFGEPRNAVFDPTTGLFTDIENMAHGRWYPTVTTLGDGRVMTFSGLLEAGGTNTSVEMYTVGSGLEPGIPRRLDAASLSAHAPQHRRSGLLCRIDPQLSVLQPVDRHVDADRRDDESQRVADLRHVRASAVDPRE